MFQSTHPCGVRRAVDGLTSCKHRVSIHAPVWGATTLMLVSFSTDGFQSTHPCGVRRLGRTTNPVAYVSIHAPVWGATQVVKTLSRQSTFQSTHPCGVRLLALKNNAQAAKFQSTHPCGVRHIDVSFILDGRVSIHAPVWGATPSF